MIKFTRSARKHRIGKAHAIHVIDSTEPVTDLDPGAGLGVDDVDRS